MKRTTRKLSGPTKDRFLNQFFASDPALDPPTARRLAAQTAATFTSLRVRREAWAQLKARTARSAGHSAPSAGAAPTINADTDPPHATSRTAPAPQDRTDPQPASEPTAEPFDPYCIGLVPVYQREGRDGLLTKLGAISSSDHLRQIARVQKIVLPQDLRSGEHEPAVLRNAITDAVARRIADRRAAAGQ